MCRCKFRYRYLTTYCKSVDRLKAQCLAQSASQKPSGHGAASPNYVGSSGPGQGDAMQSPAVPAGILGDRKNAMRKNHRILVDFSEIDCWLEKTGVPTLWFLIRIKAR